MLIERGKSTKDRRQDCRVRPSVASENLSASRTQPQTLIATRMGFGAELFLPLVSPSHQDQIGQQNQPASQPNVLRNGLSKKHARQKGCAHRLEQK